MQPTLDPAELEKKISELKSVESWLKLNLSMLSSTIQGMEVQLATITTLQQFMSANSVANKPGLVTESLPQHRLLRRRLLERASAFRLKQQAPSPGCVKHGCRPSMVEYVDPTVRTACRCDHGQYG